MSITSLVDSVQLDSDLTSIANTIRDKRDLPSSTKLTFPTDFITEIDLINPYILGSKTITANGIYDPLDDNLDGYDSVLMAVHPGLITPEEVEIAIDNDVSLEISARKGHCLGNGHVAKLGLDYGANLVLDTDTHAPGDLINYQLAERIAKGAEIPEKEIPKVLKDNPEKILKKHGLM